MQRVVFKKMITDNNADSQLFGWKCKFCEKISTSKSVLLNHIELAHQESIIQELYLIKSIKTI